MEVYLNPTLLAVLFLIAFAVSLSRSRNGPLSRIPTVGGSSAPFISYFGALYCLINAGKVIQEGYDKYKGGMFKYATLTGWQVIVTGTRLTEELYKADDHFSFEEFVHYIVQDYYTLGPSVYHNLYHVAVIRTQLTRSLDKIFPAIHNEIVTAFEDGISVHRKGGPSEWTSVPAMSLLADVVCRTSNRVLIGTKCQDPDYTDTAQTFNMDVIKSSAIMNLFPVCMKPLLGRLFSNPRSLKRALKHLGPIITERLQMFEEYGTEWADKPDDFLQWLVETAEDEERNVHALTLRILGVNIASQHTTSFTFTHALYYLASNTDYARQLRDEVEPIIQAEGWTKSALRKMRKVDSFLKESQRIMSLAASTLSRVTTKDFTFSDGTFIPEGTLVSTALRAMQLDDSVYPGARTFSPWRFYDMQEKDDEGLKHQLVSTSLTYLNFAHGRHACPGRFFAETELKAMLAHVVMTYDVRLEKEGALPPTTWIGILLMPDRKARVLFRKRQS